MDRRKFLKIGAFAAAGLAGLATCLNKLLAPTPSPITDRELPNLLIIHTDEHNFRTLGCYRDTLPPEQAFMWGVGNSVETPNIDSLAVNGALCTKFYASTPVCSPSRAAFVTGKYPQNTPVVTNEIPMRDDMVTFASILQKQGYRTGYAGKWHLDGSGRPQWAPKRKFGFEDNRFMFNRGHWKQLEDSFLGPRVKARKDDKPTYSVEGADAKSYTTDWLADKTIDFIQENKDRPFCYMVSIPDPHDPDTVRPPYDTMYSQYRFQLPRTIGVRPEDAPRWAKPTTDNNDNLDKYYGMVKCIDDNVGRILGVLKENGLTDNTIVVFTSDHGDLRGEHGRQNKGNPFEASAKIPFLLQFSGKVKPGTVVEETLGCVDFLPTILSLMGIETAGTEEGRDASEFFTGMPPTDWNDITFMRGIGNLNWVAAVTKRYKFILSPEEVPWLIDMLRDPDELINFCSNPDYRTVIHRLATQLAAYGEKYKDPSLTNSKMQRDLKWATGGFAVYDNPVGVETAVNV